MYVPSGIDDLIKNCINEDSQAWSEFVEHFSCLIFCAIKNKINNMQISLPETDINDIYQHVFFSIWQKQKLKKLKNPKNISSWLITVAQNDTVDYIKSKKHPKKTESLCKTEPASFFASGNEIHKNELEKEIEAFIDGLPFSQRRIAVLDFLYDLKYAQIAKIVGLPEGTIASAIKRIKADLKQRLFKKGYFPSHCVH